MIRVAVTGATGFIGRHLVESLAAGGVDVRAVVRPSSRAASVAAPGVTVVIAPLDAPALRSSFEGMDAVVHLAGKVSEASSDREYLDVNVEGTRAVADAARRAGVRLVHVSSLAAAGPAPPARPRSEDDPPAPLTPYGRSKLESERVVRETAGLDWVILRLAAVYGPGDRAMLPLFRAAKLGILPLTGARGAAYTFVHVSDVVRAINAALGPGLGGNTIFVGHPLPVTAREVLEGVRSAVSRPAAILPIPSALLAVAAPLIEGLSHVIGRPSALNRARYAELMAEGWVCRVDRLRDALGIVAAVDFREGLAETAEWYRREGWI